MKARLTNNLGLKLLSVFFAFFIWLLVVNVSNPEVLRSKEVLVEIKNEEILEASGLTYEIAGKNTVTVSYSVRTLDQYKIKASDFNAYIDLADLSVTGAVPVTVEVANNKDEINTITTKPQVLRVRTEELQRKRFNLEVITKGMPEEGYALGETMLTPDYVYVKGPVSMVGQISNVGIEIDVENVSSDLEGTTVPVFYDANGNKLTLDDKVTLNTEEINYRLSVLKVKNISLDFDVDGAVADNYKFTGVESEVKSISVVGLKSDLASLNLITIPKSELSVQGATSDKTVTVDLTKYLPQGVDIVGGNSEITVVLKVEALETRTYNISSEEIVKMGVSDKYMYHIDKPQITVTVRGLKEDLDSLATAGLNAAIDMSGMGIGSSKGVIQFQAGKGFEIIVYSDFNIIVTEKAVNEPDETSDGETEVSTGHAETSASAGPEETTKTTE